MDLDDPRVTGGQGYRVYGEYRLLALANRPCSDTPLDPLGIQWAGRERSWAG